MVGLTKEQRADRQRSAAGLSVDEAQREGIIMGDSRDPNAAVMQERVRIPMNSGQKMSLRGYQLEQDKYHYHWFHESHVSGGRVLDAQNAFYEICVMPDGSNVTAPSGNGTQYLMRLPLKYYREDMAASKEKRAALRKREAKLGKGEYTVNEKGRHVDEGEVIVRRSTSDNPYA